MVNELLTVNEAAGYLKVHPETVRVWLREGRIRGVKAGFDWRIYRSDIDRYLSGSVKR